MSISMRVSPLSLVIEVCFSSVFTVFSENSVELSQAAIDHRSVIVPVVLVLVAFVGSL